MTKSVYLKCLYKLNQYAKSLNIQVNLNSTCFKYDPQTHTITCDHKLKHQYAKFLSGYLHELGHAIQTQSIFSKLKKNKITLITIMIDQENDAWYNGKCIAHELSIWDDIHHVYKDEWVRNWYTYISTLPKLKVNELKALSTGYTHD